MKPCCDMLAELIALRAVRERDFSVQPVRAGDVRFFQLQARAYFDRNSGKPVSAAGPETWETLMTLGGIAFCPSCGADLQRWIGGHQAEFDAAAIPLEF